MQNICDNLEPCNVFRFFGEIAQIPHGSGNTKKMSDYCVDFAKVRNLSYWQDDKNNVIIFKPGTAGYENSEPVIIQGHMDMVCEKEQDTEIDFQSEGLSLYVDGDFLKARGTTLGGDDGIALAYALALLDSTDLSHPPLEVVFTVDEEVGMLGAVSIDLSMLKGRKLLNIDSDEEGIFLTSCAGGLCAECCLPISYREVEGNCFELKISGLLGGHSGVEIHKERANAIILIGRILKELQDEINVDIVNIEGGLMDNAIPRETTAKIVVNEQDIPLLEELVQKYEVILKKEYQTTDSGITLEMKQLSEGSYSALDVTSALKVIFFLRNIPYGVQNMSANIPGLVETSLNPGIMKQGEDFFRVSFSVRSSVTSRKEDLTKRLCFLTEFLGGTAEVSGDYPAWEYKEDSPLRKLMCECYKDLFQKEPKIQAIHAGLECGIFSGKLDELDCISFGPDNFDIHTPQERLSISSTERVWKLIVEFLKRAK